MSTTVKRGYSPNDQEEFSSKSIDKLRKAGRDLQYLLNQFTFEVHVEVINNVDAILEKLKNVITSDAVILDKCVSWINLSSKIIGEIDRDYPYIDLNSKHLRYNGIHQRG